MRVHMTEEFDLRATSPSARPTSLGVSPNRFYKTTALPPHRLSTVRPDLHIPRLINTGTLRRSCPLKQQDENLTA
jgi:hypothetical protein